MIALPPDDELPSAELDPPRLREGGAGEIERRLVASARFDRTPHAARARVAAALGVVLEPQTTSTPSPGLEAPVQRARLARFGARLGKGLAGAGIVAAVALSIWLRATPAERSAPPQAAAPLPAPAPPGARHTVPDAPDAPDAPAELSELPRLATPPAPSRAERSAPARSQRAAARTPGDAAGPGLLAEVRALEAVSAALDQGDTQRATRQLEAYRRRFARGELTTEADLLALQIAVARGDSQAARARAEQLLARPGAEHYRARVRSLLDALQPPGATHRESAEHGRSNDAAAHIRARR